jgi:hypothetical protein
MRAAHPSCEVSENRSSEPLMLRARRSTRRSSGGRLPQYRAVTSTPDLLRPRSWVTAMARSSPASGIHALAVRCLLPRRGRDRGPLPLFASLFIGNKFLAADHGPRSRADVLELALRRLLA